MDYLTDALGSVTATVNQSAQVVNTYRYKPYGTQLAKTGVGADPAYGWVGTQGYRPTQKKFSDFYVRARHYTDTLGRWSTRDTLVYLASQNLYIYADNLPVLLKDPSGAQSTNPPAIDLPPIYLPPPKTIPIPNPVPPPIRGYPPFHPGIGQSDCPGKDAVDYIKLVQDLFPNCMHDFLKLCNGQSLDKVLSQIVFVIMVHCDADPTVPCSTDIKWLGHKEGPGQPCKPLDICFSIDTCSASLEYRASSLLFEIGNWCNCKYHKVAGGEAPTENMCRDCGFPDEWCHGGTYPGPKH